MSSQEDFRRTIVYGESAINHIKRDQTPAFPKHYELWYTYSAGFNRKLNDAINQILRSRKKLSLEETTQIYDDHLSPFRSSDRLDTLSTEFNVHIENLITALDECVVANEDFLKNLKTISSKTEEVCSQEDIKSLIEQLTDVTQATIAANQLLEDRLCATKGEIIELKESLETARFETHVDELTTLGNRKRFDRSIDQVIKEHRTTEEAFCLLMVDIDRFKQFNDKWGHQTGDQVLRLVAFTLRNNIKGQDIAARYGGEEFILVLPRTKLQEASVFAENLRIAVMEKKLLKRSTGENLGTITISVGIAEYRNSEAKEALIERADCALYTAKNAGRNRVEIEPVDLQNNFSGELSKKIV